jgi:TonB family protein
MDFFLNFGLTNAVTAALLALAAAAIARFTQRPALWYALWLAVLLRLLAPPIFAVDLALPDFGLSAGNPDAPAAVAVTGGAVAPADSGFVLDPITVIAVIWAAGALVVIGFALAQSFQLKQILGASEPAVDGIATRVQILSKRLNLRRAPPTVQVLDRVPPMLWAFFGSVRLILPAELLAKLDGNETDTLLAHELAHLSRRDHWVRHIELASLALFWWNPIAWWATKRVRRAQELCCDQRVAELLPNHRRAYADTLVETARFLSGRHLPLGSPARAMADLTQLKGRITMIMTTDRAPTMSLSTKLAAAIILVTALAITPMINAKPDAPDYRSEPISLSLEDADLHDVLATFSEVSGIEILIDPGISGTVTTEFENVPWDKALAKILQSQGLVGKMENDQLIVRRFGSERLVPPAPPKPPGPAPVAGRLDGEEIFQYVPDSNITEPKALEKVNPKYPPEMRKAGTSGSVVARLVIDDAGHVRDVEVLDSPAAEFSAAATEAFEQWTFEPATMDGKPVAVRYIVTVLFRLK